MKRALAALVCAMWVSSATLAQPASPSTKPASADALIQQIQALRPPTPDESKIDDPQYVQSFLKQRNEFLEKRGELAKQLFDAYPDHPQAVPLMLQRWVVMAQQEKLAQVMQETDKAMGVKMTEDNRKDLMYIRAVAQIVGRGDATGEKASAAIDEFIKLSPKDERGAELLFHLMDEEKDTTRRIATYRRIVEQYPEAAEAAQAKSAIRQADGMGKPFELSFTEATSGKSLNLQKDLKGKVVVIDFWATWCGPCIEEMPKMKALYEKYKDKGVEFIGVSLDQPESEGGLTKLKAFVQKEKIGWPQYYQGNYWNSEFSKGWGINAIPAVFVVDADGKLANVNARGQLETLIPELIAKRDGK